MRLTCPNCGAQYEVPDEVIPEDGRDVQCSNCDHTWFQPKYPDQAEPSPEPALAEAAEVKTADSDVAEADTTNEASESTPDAAAKPEPEPETEKPAAATSGNVDPAVATILQQEAARESELRAQEGVTLQSQPDLALDTAPVPKVEPKRPSATETAEDSGQKDALPDVEAINSSLRSDEADAAPAEPVRKSGGFVRGFALILIMGVVLYLIYSNAQQISEAVPQVDPVLQSYVSLVDQARIWLEAQAGSGASQN